MVTNLILNNFKCFDLKNKPSRSDIFIFGGGIGGISAALAAARDGARVCLVDPSKDLGGFNGEDGQFPMDYTSSCNDPYFRESGIFEEIICVIREENKEGTFCGQSRALYSIISREPNITPMLGFNCLDVAISPSKDRIESCTIINHSRSIQYLHRAQYFIDCSNTGEFSKLGNAPGEYRNPVNLEKAKTEYECCKFSVVVEIDSSSTPSIFKCPDWVKMRWEENSSDARIAFVKSLEKKLCGFHLIEWDKVNSSYPNPNELCWSAWDFIKNRSPMQELSKNLFIKRIIPKTRTEATFRGIGDYLLTEEDATLGKSFYDSVAVARCPISKRNKQRAAEIIKLALPQSFEIPLRCLYSKKIKNLLWAGPHISCDEIISLSLAHPPTLSQLGCAVGYCASKSISKSRQPRTLAKEGRIEELKKDWEKKNHRTQRKTFKDEDNLIPLAKVSASTTWQNKDFHELVTETGRETDACLVQFPITSDSLESVSLLMKFSEIQKIDVRLLEGSPQNPNIPGSCLQTDILEIKETGDQRITISFETDIATNGYHFLEIRSDKKFCIVEGKNSPVGHLVQYPRKNLPLDAENPYSEYCVKTDYSPLPHRSAIIETWPEQKAYNPIELTTDNSRPGHLPGLWISQTSKFKYPEFIEFQWPSPITAARIDIFFDPCFGYHTPPQPHGIAQDYANSLVKDYKIYITSIEGKTKLIEHIKDNSSPHRFHLLDSPIIQSIEIEILSTHGLDRAQIFRVAVYD